jgi:hypothetical protein
MSIYIYIYEGKEDVSNVVRGLVISETRVLYIHLIPTICVRLRA